MKKIYWISLNQPTHEELKLLAEREKKSIKVFCVTDIAEQINSIKNEIELVNVKEDYISFLKKYNITFDEICLDSNIYPDDNDQLKEKIKEEIGKATSENVNWTIFHKYRKFFNVFSFSNISIFILGSIFFYLLYKKVIL